MNTLLCLSAPLDIFPTLAVAQDYSLRWSAGDHEDFQSQCNIYIRIKSKKISYRNLPCKQKSIPSPRALVKAIVHVQHADTSMLQGVLDREITVCIYVLEPDPPEVNCPSASQTLTVKNDYELFTVSDVLTAGTFIGKT